MNVESDILVKVEGLSKKFCKDLKTSLKYGVIDLFGGSTNKNHLTLRKNEFWAVKDVSFELRRGECLGLIGHNGAGKSTLLKILNGLINPDDGKVTIKGRVGALIELGAGFNPILTGRENIYNNGAVLGFTKKEIDAKLQTIIDFAELEEFIDMPVQHYSSGMKVRLGFAVAAQMEPDVLLIDEVLAVGDLGFVLKCFKVIDAILPMTAVVFVSHNMPMIARICNQVMLINRGRIQYCSENVSEGVDFYYDKFLADEEPSLVYTDHSLELVNAKIVGVEKKNSNYSVCWGQTIHLVFCLKNFNHSKTPYVSLVFYDKEQRPVAEALPKGQELSVMSKNKREIIFTIEIRNIYLSKGIYSVTLTLNETVGKNIYYKIHKALIFNIEHEQQIWTPFLLDSKLIDIKYQ